MPSRQPSLWTAAGLEPAKPVHPVAAWVGGKRSLAPELIQLIQETPHETYAEPFVGMGGVFFRRDMRPKAEVINDRSRDVANLFRIVREHFVPFVDMIRYQITTRVEFDRLSKVDPDTLTDLQRAARFLYLQRTTFGGKVDGRTFGVSPGEPGAFDVGRVVPLLEDLHDRLKSVIIECLDWRVFVERYDRQETLFYLDPPYAGAEHYYGKGLFTPQDFPPLAAQLAGIKGRFILSINDTPSIREIFGRFEMRRIELTYTIAATEATPAGELIITGPS